MFSERFGSLFSNGLLRLQTYRGVQSQIIENELTSLLNCHPQALSRWQQGFLPPADIVEKLLLYFNEQHFFNRLYLSSLGDSGGVPLSHIDALHLPIEDDTTQMYTLVPRHNLPVLSGPLQQLLETQHNNRAEVIKGIQSRWRLVVIRGVFGVGKSTLAIYTAYHIMQNEPSLFQWAVYITGKTQPITLESIFTSLVNGLNPRWTGLLGSDITYQTQRIVQLLREESILLVLDNFDTFKSSSQVLEFLYQIPEPSKAIITTRTSIIRYAYTIDLNGMQDQDAIKIANLYAVYSGSTKQWHDHPEYSEIRKLVGNTEGNPFISKILPACVAFSTQSLPYTQKYWKWATYNESLLTGKSTAPDVALELIEGMWEYLTTDHRALLKAFTFFVDSATVDALTTTAGILHKSKSSQRLEELNRWGLIDQVTAPVNAPRYTIHSLIASFVQDVVDNESDWRDTARSRWVKWYEVWITRQDEEEWNEYEPRRLEAANLFALITYLQQNPSVIAPRLARGLHRYLTFQGLWNQAAELTPKWQQKFELEYRITTLWLRSHSALLQLEQNQISQAIPLLESILKQCEKMSARVPQKYNELVNKIGILLHLGQAYSMRSSAEDEKRSRFFLEEGLAIAVGLKDDENVVRFRYQCAVTALRFNHYDEAISALKLLLEEERCQNWIRARGYILIRLVETLIKTGNLKEAAQQVQMLRAYQKFPKDEPLLWAARAMALARFEAAQGNPRKAITRTTSAIEIYERFNHTELKEAEAFRNELLEQVAIRI